MSWAYRYSRHYQVMCLRSADEALRRLEALAAAGDEVALVLAGERLSGTTGSEFLTACGTGTRTPSAGC